MTEKEVTAKIEGWCKEGRLYPDILTCLEKDKRLMNQFVGCLDGYDLFPKIPNDFKAPANDY